MRRISIVALFSVGALLISGCATSATSSTSSEPIAEQSSPMASEISPGPSESREAGWGLRSVRFCITKNSGSPLVVDPIAPTTGGTADLDTGPASQCYVGSSDNLSAWEKAFRLGFGESKWGAVQYLYDNDTRVAMLVRNPMLERPDVLLCTDQSTSGSRDDCTKVLGMNTFSTGDTYTMDGLGHHYRVKRIKDSSDNIEFTIELID